MIYNTGIIGNSNTGNVMFCKWKCGSRGIRVGNGNIYNVNWDSSFELRGDRVDGDIHDFELRIDNIHGKNYILYDKITKKSTHIPSNYTDSISFTLKVMEELHKLRE